MLIKQILDADIANCYEALENDERLVFKASSKAEKAVDYILNIERT